MNTIELARDCGFYFDYDIDKLACSEEELFDFADKLSQQEYHIGYEDGYSEGYNRAVETNKAEVEFYKTALDCVIGLERSRTTGPTTIVMTRYSGSESKG
jgi:hypothetical protein